MITSQPRDQRGSAVLEMVILAPVLLLILGLGVAGARVVLAHQEADSVAGQAARAASIARDPTQAIAAAQDTATAALAQSGLSCSPMAVSVDTSGFRAGGSVAVTITCTVQLGSLMPASLVGARTISGRATAPIDTYRGLSS